MDTAATDRPRPLTRMQWSLLAAVLLVGAGLRAAYLTEVVHEPGFEHPLHDPQYNDYWARALVTGDWTPPGGERP